MEKMPDQKQIEELIEEHERLYPDVKRFMDRIRLTDPDMHLTLRNFQMVVLRQSILRMRLEKRVTMLEELLLKRN